MFSTRLAHRMGRHGLHYGWIVAAITFLTALSSSAALGLPGALLKPLSREFGWSVDQISTALAVRFALFGLMGPFSALLMERFGLRNVMVTALAVIAAGLGLVRQMTDFWQLVLLLGVMLGIGSGMTALVLNAVVANRWFEQRRGLVMGLLTASSATGQLVFLPIGTWLIEHGGWRMALLPVMFSLIDAVESALSDIFRAPRRTHWGRLLLLGGLLTLAPLGSVLTVRYDHLLMPLLLIAALLYGIFRRLPRVRISDRAALSGALTAGILLSLAKVGFGLYATHLARSIHIIWGAIAFVPLLLIWVLLSWSIVLFGAELTSVLEMQLAELETLSMPRRKSGSLRRRRLRRRIVHKRRRDTAPPPPALKAALRPARGTDDGESRPRPPSPTTHR